MSKHARRRRYRARRRADRTFWRIVRALRAAGGAIDLGMPPIRPGETAIELPGFQFGWL